MSGWSVLPPDVERMIAAIASDHTSGASRLARMGIEALTTLVRTSGGPVSGELIREAVQRLADAQPANAALYNVAQMFGRLVAEGHNPKDVLVQLQAELESAPEKVARNFLKVAPEADHVVTLSYSDNVLACLRLAREKGRLRRAYVMESRPLMEGRSLAIALERAGLHSVVVPDALGPVLMADAAYAILGADSILRDAAVVNKVGSYGLALAAADHRKDAYVACETLKFDARYEASGWPGSRPMPPEQVWETRPERIEVMNQYFEVVPARLVTRVATERGTFTPDIIQTMLARSTRQAGP